MKYRIAVGTFLAVGVLVSTALADKDLKSGPQVGSSSIAPFNPLHVTGDTAGQKLCLV